MSLNRKTVKQLLEERAQKFIEMETASQAGDAEKRELTEQEFADFKKLKDEVSEIDTKIERARELEDIQKMRAITVGTGAEGSYHHSEKDERDLNSFSLGKLIRSKMNGEALTGIEKEMMDEGVKELQQRGVTPKGNIVIPYDVFVRDKSGRDTLQERFSERRDMTVTGGSNGNQGGLTVQTNIGRLFEALFNKLVLREMGATFMPGLVGNLDLPRLVKDTAPDFKGETAAATEASPTFVKASLTPHRLPSFIEFSNQLLHQSEYNITQVLQSYLLQSLSTKFDQAGIAGSGVSNEPTGILNTVGIGAIYAGAAPLSTTNADGSAPVWADFPNFYKELAIDNADFGSLGFLLNPQLVAKLQTIVKVSGTDTFIMPEGARTLNGFKVGITNNVPSNLTKGSGTGLSAALFGNFRDAWMGTWGGIELQVNPYSLDTTGMTRIVAALFCDVAVVRPESFSAAKDFITT